jgi:GTP-binding protein LepA
MTDQSHIRNFSIIAHIDHGKSTLADRMLEKCNAVSQREMASQLLDNMDLERERGITIKARAVKLNYRAQDGEDYELNLIDTPGHVDFNYEVSRSLAACEGAVLVVDATQGVEAQTLANTYLAMEHDLEILPVINKIDLPAADPKKAKQEIEDIIGMPAMDAPEISAKMGINIEAVLEEIVHKIPAPKGDNQKPLKALIFDSQYDSYRGVIVLHAPDRGHAEGGADRASDGHRRRVRRGGVRSSAAAGTGALRDAGGRRGGLFHRVHQDCQRYPQVGDTVTDAERPATEALPGYRPVQPMVFCGIYTEDGSKYPDLRDALEKAAAQRRLPVL